MKRAIKRLLQARENGEKITIWGDFDADGITATSVLWEGLGQFFTQNQQLTYTIPNRLTDSHGLNNPGIQALASNGTTLIITCDNGSSNQIEIDYANELGIDVIVTDHHTLPEGTSFQWLLLLILAILAKRIHSFICLVLPSPTN